MHLFNKHAPFSNIFDHVSWVLSLNSPFCDIFVSMSKVFKSVYLFLRFQHKDMFCDLPTSNIKLLCLKLHYIPKKPRYVCYLDEKMLYMLAFLKMSRIIAFFSQNNIYLLNVQHHLTQAVNLHIENKATFMEGGCTNYIRTLMSRN